MTTFHQKLAAIALTFTLAACGGSDSNSETPSPTAEAPTLTTPPPDTSPPDTSIPDPTPTGPSGLVFLADGTTVHTATTTDTAYTQLGSAAIPDTDLTAGHQIFSLLLHPNKKWLYAASETAGAWGNARINRFEVDWSTGAITYVDAFLLNAGSGPSCAEYDGCAPVGLGITADGTRLIVEENSEDTFLTFAISSDGSLSYLNSAASGIAGYHGVGLNAAGTYLYHGSMAYSRSGDTITALNNGGQVGNASVVLNIGGTERLYTTLDVSEVGVLDLTDPAAPAVIAAINPDPATGGSKAVYMDVTKDGSRILAVGDGSVAIVDFDGTSLTRRDQLVVTGRARGAAFIGDGSTAVVTFQTGGAKLYSVATDGTLTEVASVTSTNATRAVLFATRP